MKLPEVLLIDNQPECQQILSQLLNEQVLAEIITTTNNDFNVILLNIKSAVQTYPKILVILDFWIDDCVGCRDDKSNGKLTFADRLLTSIKAFHENVYASQGIDDQPVNCANAAKNKVLEIRQSQLVAA